MQKYFFIIFLFALTSCKKNDDPVAVVEEPVFKVTGTLNGQPLDIKAGENDYVMFTDYTYESSSSVYEFNGSLRKYNCASCPNTLNIKIRNYVQTSSSQTLFPDTIFINNYYALKSSGNSSTQYTFNFTGQTFGPVTQTKWIFGDGESGLGINQLHTYSHPGEYTTAFIALYANGCLDTIYNTFSFGIPQAKCRANFGVSIFGDSITIANSAAGTEPLSYHWNFGDGNFSTAFEPSHVYSTGGIYKVTLLVTDAENRTAEFNRKVIILPTSDCLASMNYPGWVSQPNPYFLSTATIEYVDASGETFSTINNLLPDNDYFRILSSEDYAANANGDRVKKLKVEFQCRLYNQSQTSYLDIAVTDGVIGVAYK